MNLIFCIIATGLVENLMFPIILMITISIVCFEIAIKFFRWKFSSVVFWYTCQINDKKKLCIILKKLLKIILIALTIYVLRSTSIILNWRS